MRQTLEVQHLTHITDRGFDEVIARARDLTGSVEEGFASVLADVEGREAFETRIHEREGKSGFMRFLEIDHGAWLSRYYELPSRAVTLVVGNPLVALTMLRHDVAAGLNVPFRMMIQEGADGRTHVSYDLPSTLMSGIEDPALQAAARALDGKIEGFAESITGARA